GDTTALSPSGARASLPSSSRKSASTRSRVAFPPAPCARLTRSSRSTGRRRRAPSGTDAGFLARAAQAAVGEVRGTGTLARHHAGSERPLGRAGGAEDSALPRLDLSREHLAAA